MDPTETQPLPWKAHEARRRPWAEMTVELPGGEPVARETALPDRLAERGYRLRSRLGSGRLGAIHEAQDDLSRSSGSQHFIAIQLIDDRIVSRPGFAADFERGARELQSISHPNIVKLLEYGRDGSRYYLVWELLESASLRFVLNDVNVLPAEEMSAVLRAVGDALLYLHAKPLVHGNLTPENVLVTFGYEVKLLDIVPSGWLDNPEDDLGVPARKPDKRDDVFGLGCLAYEMLAGRHPYNGNTAQEAYRAGLEAAPIASLGARQWRALAGALAVHRDDRTPNVAQFLQDFGVTDVERLRSVVSANAEDTEPPRVPEFPDIAKPAPAPERPGFRLSSYEHAPRSFSAERAMPYETKRGGLLGRAMLLAFVLAAAALVWLYQEPLRQGLDSLVASVDSELTKRGAPAPTGPTSPTASSETSPGEPLPRTATVTDPEPATVLAPGATAPEPEPSVTESRLPPPAETTTADTLDAETARPLPEAARPTPEPTLPAPEMAAIESPAAAAGPMRFGFLQPVMTVRESEVAARIIIRRSGDLSGPATVAWWTTEGTAKADVDYADLGARIEQFAPGEASRTVFVPLIRDASPGPTKSFTVYLGRGDDARNGEPTSGMRVEIVGD